ncbi:MAG: hypothetical protein NXI04_04265 [Planctomycetaceae bacterium]|nr:hypothetical protein [Planctomycetaceae bacterium]
MHALFTIKPIFDDARYGRFFLSEDEPSVLGRTSLAADLNAEPSFADGRPIPSLKDVWPTPTVSGDIGDSNDYPSIYPWPVFSGRAISLLKPLLSPYGEFLPLNTPIGQFSVFHVRTVHDVLDTRASAIVFDHGSDRRALAVEHFVPVASKLAAVTSDIFRIPQLPQETFVSPRVYELMRDSDLEGMEFYRAYPVRAHEPIWYAHPFTGPSDQPPAALYGLRLEFSLKQAEPSVVESRRFANVSQEIACVVAKQAACELRSPVPGPGRLLLEVTCGHQTTLQSLQSELIDYLRQQKWWTAQHTCELLTD